MAISITQLSRCHQISDPSVYCLAQKNVNGLITI